MKKRRKIDLPQSGDELVSMLMETYSIDSGAGLLLVQQAAHALDQALEAEALIREHGMVTMGERGLRPNPACSISRDARNRLLAALRALNLEL